MGHVVNRNNGSNQHTWDKRPWTLAIIATASYPFLLKLFSWSIYKYNNLDNLIYIMLAIIAVLIAVSIPFLTVWALTTIRNKLQANTAAMRILLYLFAATAPVYILTLQIMGFIGISAWHTGLWCTLVLVMGLFLTLTNNNNSRHRKTNYNYKIVRRIHGISAILLIFGFVGLHLSNHVFALDSNILHEEFRVLFNSWYQSDYVEPALFALLATMGISGVLMARRYTGSQGDIFRHLQISSGIFLIFFLCAHVNAVLSARSIGTETDWIFATGQNGLINSSGILIPYYLLSVVMIILHASLGLRTALLSHKTSPEKANKVFYVLISLGAAFSIVISAAVLGLRI